MRPCFQLPDRPQALRGSPAEVRTAVPVAAESLDGTTRPTGPVSTRREERAEVGVCGDEHPFLKLRAIEDLPIGGCLESVIADVFGVVSGSVETFSDDGRERVVDQELHPEAVSGNSRSRTASAA